MKLALIMLAAGNSRRFGSNKLVYHVEGKEMYLHTLEQLFLVKEALQEGVSCQITVVTQYQEITEAAKKMGAHVLLNAHPEEGISSSLKIGLRANLDSRACLFTVADQPWLTAETVECLIREFLESGRDIGCISQDGTPGNPCIFAEKYYQELLMLEGDKGGKKVLKAHPEDVFFLPATNWILRS